MLFFWSVVIMILIEKCFFFVLLICCYIVFLICCCCVFDGSVFFAMFVMISCCCCCVFNGSVTVGYRRCRVVFLVSGSLVLAGERFRRVVDDEKEDDGTQDDEHVSLDDDTVVCVGTENKIKTLQFGGIKTCLNVYFFHSYVWELITNLFWKLRPCCSAELGHD